MNEPYTYVRQVETLARADGLSWETINAGVDGLGTNGELAVLSETGLSVSPDVVVLGFYHNEFLESPGISSRGCQGLSTGVAWRAPAGERGVSIPVPVPVGARGARLHRRC